MKVPLTIRDFLDRAELVYGDRVAVVDEPDQPAPSLGEVTYREVARRARAAGGARRPRRGGGRPGRRRQPELRPACSRSLLGVPCRAGCSCRSTSGSRRTRSATSSGTPARGCSSSTPSSRPASSGVEAEHRFVLGRGYEQLLAYDTEPRPWAEPDEDATATINYTRARRRAPRACR